MEKESDPRKRAIADSDRELARVTDKYKHNWIMDDGESDALAYAATQVRYADVMKDGWLKERWAKAIEEAIDPDNPSLDRLRREIEEEGNGFIETAGDEKRWIEYGRALLNVARSF